MATGMLRSALLALALLLAGCSEPAGDARPAAEVETPGATTGGGNGTSAPEDPDVDVRLATTLWFTGDLGLAAEAPVAAEASRVLQGVGTEAFVTGVGAPTGWSGAAQPVDWLVTSARVVLYVASEGATASLGPGTSGLPEFFTWLGPLDAPMGGGTGQGPDALPPGQVSEVAFDLGVPLGGLVLEAGEPLAFQVIGTYPQSASSNRLAYLVGGTDAPARIEIVASRVTLPEDLVEVPIPEVAGTVRGDGCTAPGQEGAQVATFPLTVPPEALGLRLALDRTGGPATNEDLDLVVLAPDGSVVAAGHTPRGDELVRLHAPNLAAAGPGAWAFRVVSCAAQSADFTVSGALLVAADAAVDVPADA